MGKIDKREMQWVRGLFRTSNPDKRDIIGVYKGVMELVGINKALKKHIKCLKEVIRLKELKEPKEEDIDKKALAISALCGGGVELAIKILHHLKNIQTESPKEAPEVKEEYCECKIKWQTYANGEAGLICKDCMKPIKEVANG